jgi:hypothetical protein
VGIPQAGNTALQQLQAVRAGGPPFIVTLSNSNATVAQLASDQPATTGQTVTKPILAGDTNTAANGPGTTYGLTFDPLAAGSTTVTVTGPAGVLTMSSSGVQTVTVGANITPVVSIQATTPEASEGGAAGTFTITRVGGNTALAVPVSFTRTGTAGAGTDYANFSLSATIPAGQASTTVTVTPVNDILAETDETVILTLVDTGNDYNLGAPGTETATVTILDAGHVVTIAATDATAAEAGADTGTFTITRSGNTTLALPVSFTRTGTAAAGADYTNFSLSATIPAGQAATTITVTPVDDALVEGPETIILTLTDTANYNLGAAGTDTATVTIFDSDPLVLTFEEQADSIPIGTLFPTSYNSMTFINWQHYSPYPAVFLPHGTNAIFASVDGATITFTDRVFVGASFSRWVGGPGPIFFELYQDGVLVHTSATLADTPPALTFLPSGYSGLVDEVRVRSLGSTITPQGSTWIIDDITFQ